MRRFSLGDEKKDRFLAVDVAAGTFLLGLLSFSDLIGMFYPVIGYCGLVYLGCVVYKKIKEKKNVD